MRQPNTANGGGPTASSNPWLVLLTALIVLGAAPSAFPGAPTFAPDAAAFDALRHPIPRGHPRLFGTRHELQELSRQRPQAYARVQAVARDAGAPDHQRMISLGLVSAIENDAGLAREAINLALGYVEKGVRRGHVPFGHDLALGAFVFDLCHEHWTGAERRAFIDYFNATAIANENYGAGVFHNGWWGYKNWGLGVAAYATWHENDQAARILAGIEHDYRERAAPALELAGAGGGWAEGYYIHYWLYEWLLFCEIARRNEAVDYHALAPNFYRNRAVASMFEMFPGMSLYQSRRPIPIGDGGGRTFGGDRDKVLSARRILVNRYRNDPGHQVAHAYNQQTPRSSVGVNAYKDFLWHDPSVPAGDLDTFRLSHHSTGAGHVHARSSWADDATYFFFKASDRFTSHQHLDAGHFLIYRHEELAGDAGHYDSFGSDHDVNFHLRTISHNTILVHDPRETWPAIRAGKVAGNDGGQHHNWPHHNGAVNDPQQWHAGRRLYDIVDMLAFSDRVDYLHVAADATRAYSPDKLENFTRHIVYLRPSTFVIFDRVAAKDAAFQKTWLLHAMREPVTRGNQHVITHGGGRLFIQTLLPERTSFRLFTGEDLHRYDNGHFPPARETGPAPQARIEIQPARPAKEHHFLHVLHAADAAIETVEDAGLTLDEHHAIVTVKGHKITFANDGSRARVERLETEN